MRPTEILTLAPLGALTVVLGLYPALVLDLITGPVKAVLAAVDPAVAMSIGR
jgi:NADH:ubiquinone oxidoreductase subunit 4 (subunit M)